MGDRSVETLFARTLFAESLNLKGDGKFGKFGGSCSVCLCQAYVYGACSAFLLMLYWRRLSHIKVNRKYSLRKQYNAKL